MNNKKSDRQLIEDIYAVLFGNPTHQTGLIARVEALEKAVKNNTRISWAIFLLIAGATIAVIFA